MDGTHRISDRAHAHLESRTVFSHIVNQPLPEFSKHVKSFLRKRATESEVLWLTREVAKSSIRASRHVSKIAKQRKIEVQESLEKRKLQEFAPPRTKVQQAATKVSKPKGPSTTRQRDVSGTVYLLFHGEFNALKIGITAHDATTDRIATHRLNGWIAEQVWTLNDIRTAELIEGQVKAWLRNHKKLPIACTPEQMPQGGYTETVSRDLISAEELRAFVDQKVLEGTGQGGQRTAMKDLVVGATMRTEGQIVDMRVVKPIRLKGRTIQAQWQQLSVQDNSGILLVELSGRNQVPPRHLRIGRCIQVTGRTELVQHSTKTLLRVRQQNVYRMTNPAYVLLAHRDKDGSELKVYSYQK